MRFIFGDVGIAAIDRHPMDADRLADRIDDPIFPNAMGSVERCFHAQVVSDRRSGDFDDQQQFGATNVFRIAVRGP